MSKSGRDTSQDGFGNKTERFLLTNFRPFWAFVNAQPTLAQWFNDKLVNRAVNKLPARPAALSTMCDYTSWASLTDQSYFSRYLKSEPEPPDLPTPERVANELFKV